MLKSRKELLAINPVFTGHLLQQQQARYAPASPWEVGESVVLDDAEGVVVLTEEQAEQLNQEDRHYFEDNRDKVEVPVEPQVVERKTIIASQETAAIYLKEIGEAFAEISRVLGPMLVLGDWNTPWLSQENDYPPVAAALHYLKERVDSDFNGGFLLEADAIPSFIHHLFWLTRGNASLPAFLFSFERAKSVAQLCKYGVLHLDFYDLQERNDWVTYFAELGFLEVDRCQDPVDFDNFEGRVLF